MEELYGAYCKHYNSKKGLIGGSRAEGEFYRVRAWQSEVSKLNPSCVHVRNTITNYTVVVHCCVKCDGLHD